MLNSGRKEEVVKGKISSKLIFIQKISWSRSMHIYSIVFIKFMFQKLKPDQVWRYLCNVQEMTDATLVIPSFGLKPYFTSYIAPQCTIYTWYTTFALANFVSTHLIFIRVESSFFLDKGSKSNWKSDYSWGTCQSSDLWTSCYKQNELSTKWRCPIEVSW